MNNRIANERWEVFGSEDTPAVWVEDKNGHRVCTVRNCEDDLDRARLIAAAPELLAALKLVDEALPWADDRELPEGSPRLIMRQAIAKAEGRK